MAGGVTGGAAGTWSDRFEQGLHPFIEAFNASIGFDKRMWQQDIDGSRAYVKVYNNKYISILKMNISIKKQLLLYLLNNYIYWLKKKL